MNRPSWDSYFLEIARVVASRSTCLRRQVGAVLVMDRRLLTTGYNGSPRGLTHCEEIGCLREKRQVPPGERHELCRGLHAEQNAIIQAAIYGVSIKGATLYCTHYPCVLCAKMLVNSGVRNLVVSSDYPDQLSKQLLEEAGVAIKLGS
ncbi:MAG TPA: cytidine deaminase [Firmicutes bacterium]|nr:cytidine deaminase [Bacillota bacterium]